MRKYYIDTRKGVIATTDGVVDDKYKTIIMTLDNGKEQPISVATFHTYWRELEKPQEAVKTPATTSDVPKKSNANRTVVQKRLF